MTTTSNIHFVWEAAEADSDHTYYITYYTSTGTAQRTTTNRDYTATDYLFSTNTQGGVAGWVQTYFEGVSNSYALSDQVDCTIITLDPTTSPTRKPSLSPTSGPSQAPTAKPTFTRPKTWITGDICESDRCDCNDAAWTCSSDEIDRQFLASTDEQFITLRMYPSNYPNVVNISWSITYLGETDENGNIIRRRRNLLQFMSSTTAFTEEGITPTSGIASFDPSDNNEDIKIGVSIQIYDSIAGSNYRKYLLSIDTCNTYNYTCIPVYPSELIMIVDISGGDVISISSTEKEIPQWLWWVIGAIILFLFILAWLVYKYWFSKKHTEDKLHETEYELDNALKENELGFGHELGDTNVGFNPLNEGAPKAYKAPTIGLTGPPKDEEDLFPENAHVNIEKFNVKHEFGPMQGNRTNEEETQSLI